jgi:aspartate racemase
MIIYNKPDVPDRTDYILGRSSESPLNAIIAIGRALVGDGDDFIAIPCITGHFFYDEIQRNISVPVINMLAETAVYLKKNGVTKAGIMATDGTIYSGFFKKELELSGIEVAVPGKETQKKVMSIIYYGIKADKPFDLYDFKLVDDELREQGAQVVILGCTELSLIKRNCGIGPGFLDVTEVLAARAIELSDGILKSEYRCLIT